ncbi:hypothetical protein, partial [Arcanobacterium phocae]|uniref:hypothetical protein n=1 Tax=Arcanobacterium phocae TaxID=131112 RepID=UPI00209FF27B
GGGGGLGVVALLLVLFHHCLETFNVFVLGVVLVDFCLSFLFFAPSFPPRLWLHRRQMIRPFVRVSFPPLVLALMWSASGLFGCPCVFQAMSVAQIGQCVWLLRRAWWMRFWRHCLWRVVPVRDVAMFTA